MASEQNSFNPIQEQESPAQTHQHATESSENDDLASGMQNLGIKCNISIHVDVEKCHHFLEAAADDYNDVQEVSEMLDPGQGGGAQKSIMALMANTLNNEDFIHIWRSCRGGQAPAMGLMYHLSKTKVMTLLQFKILVEATDEDYFQRPIDYMNKLMKEKDIANIILDDLDFQHFEKIANMLSPTPNSGHVTKQRTWKNVAGRAGVKIPIVDALDTPTRQDLEQRSLTEEYFRYMASANPECEVAYIAKGLVNIKRDDVVRSCKMFEQCRIGGCLKIPSKKAIKDAEEQKRQLEEQKRKNEEQIRGVEEEKRKLDQERRLLNAQKKSIQHEADGLISFT